MGKMIFTTKNLIQNFTQQPKYVYIYLKPCLGARILHPSTAVIQTQYMLLVGVRKEHGNSELRNTPSPTQYIPSIYQQ